MEKSSQEAGKSQIVKGGISHTKMLDLHLEGHGEPLRYWVGQKFIQVFYKMVQKKLNSVWPTQYLKEEG